MAFALPSDTDEKEEITPTPQLSTKPSVKQNAPSAGFVLPSDIAEHQEKQAEQQTGDSQLANFFRGLPSATLGGLSKSLSAAGQSEAAEMADPGLLPHDIPQPEEIQKHLEQNITGELEKPVGKGGEYATAVGDILGSPATWLTPGLGGIGTKLGTGVGAGLGSQLGKDIGGLPGQIAGGLLGGFAGAKTAQRVGTQALTPVMKQKPISMTTDQQFSTADQLYDRAINPAIAFKDDARRNFAQNVIIDLWQDGKTENIAPTAFKTFKRFMEEVNPLTGLSDMRQVHSVMKEFRSILRGGYNGDEKDVASYMLGSINKWLQDLPKNPGALARGHAEMKNAVTSLKSATEMWAHASRSDTIEEALRSAINTAKSTGSGMNIENSARSAIRRIMNNPLRRKGFQADELADMQKIIDGDFKGNVLRFLGKMSPTGVVSGVLGLELGHALFKGGIRQFLPLIIGHLARGSAERKVLKEIEDLSQKIRLKPTAPKPPPPKIIRPNILAPGAIAPMLGRIGQEQQEETP